MIQNNAINVPPLSMLRHIEQKFNDASGIAVNFAVSDFSLVGSSYVATKSVPTVAATDKLLLQLAPNATSAAKAEYNSAVFDSGTDILTCTLPEQPTADLSIWIMDRVTAQVHGTNVADLTYETVSGNNIKFTSNMLDTTGVYDSTLGMTQREFNSKCVVGDTLGYKMFAGFRDFSAAANTTTTVTEDLRNFIPEGYNIIYGVATVCNALTPYTEITGPALIPNGRLLNIRVHSTYSGSVQVHVGYIVFYI